MKKILILGGTQFVGQNLVEELLNLEKYDITLFNRGKTNPDLFPQAKRIIGDRKTADIEQIGGQDWDVVFDISGYWPIPLEKNIEILKGRVGRYVFVSTMSVYDFDTGSSVSATENHTLLSCTEEQKTDNTAASYGQRKVACEQILQKNTWLDKIILRPALIVGRYDHTDRLYYWFHKAQTQNAFLIPEGNNVISYTDVEDLTQTMIQAINVQNHFTTYNAYSYSTSIRAFVQKAMKHSGRTPELINAPPQLLEKYKVEEWTGIPLWVNSDYLTIDNSRLLQDFDLTLNTSDQTTEALMAYYANSLKWRQPNSRLGAISLEKEKTLMDLLRKDV